MHIKNPTAPCIYVATLPCETLMSANYKECIYLNCGCVVNNQIKTGLLLSLRVKTFLKSVNISQSYKQERDCFVHFLRLFSSVLAKRTKCVRITFLLVTLPNIHRFKNFFFTHRLSKKPFLTCLLTISRHLTNVTTPLQYLVVCC